MHSYEMKLVSQKRQHFTELTAKLDAMSPLKVLTRGYALVSTSQGLVRSVQQIHEGDHLKITLHDGNFNAKIVDNEEMN